MRHTLLILLSFLVITLKANSDKKLVYDNEIYEDKVKTVMLTQKGSYQTLALLTLGSDRQLELQFDNMNVQNEFYQYTFIHCDANWKPTKLQKNQYMAGTQFGFIENYKLATNTYVKYAHYSLNFPVADMKPSIAGNYIILVYKNFDEEDIVLSKRFMIQKSKVLIEGKVNFSSQVKYRQSKQEVDFKVKLNGYTVPNPMADIKAVILQNFRWDNAIYNLKPRMNLTNILSFDYDYENNFNGGNEFRFFDMRSFRSVAYNVRRRTIGKDKIRNIEINADQSRNFLAYKFFKDYNGGFIINNRDGSTAVIDEDYVRTNFTYLKSKSYQNDLYVIGAFSDWKLKEEYKLTYFSNLGRYRGDFMLKQGMYNYAYAVKKDDGSADMVSTEGSYSETVNTYTVFIYHKNQMYGYDELIGVQDIEYKNIRN